MATAAAGIATLLAGLFILAACNVSIPPEHRCQHTDGRVTDVRYMTQAEQRECVKLPASD